jgi:broad specificity phosphatase PhoE
MDTENRAQGTRGFPLTPESKRDIKAVAEEMKSLPFDVIVSSDLHRAVQTAKIVSDVTGRPYVLEEYNLRPWDYGDLVGKDEDLIFILQCEQYLPNPDECMPGGESFNEFKERYLDCIEGIIAGYTGQTILVISHSVNERLTRAWDKAGRGREVNMREMMTKNIGPGEWEKIGGRTLFPTSSRSSHVIQ